MNDRKAALTELEEVYQECISPDWDCYHARPVSKETYEAAKEFLLAIAGDIESPGFGAEPNGCISFEWHFDNEHTLTAGISQNKIIHYAALFGGGSIRGTAGMASPGLLAYLFSVIRGLKAETTSSVVV